MLAAGLSSDALEPTLAMSYHAPRGTDGRLSRRFARLFAALSVASQLPDDEQERLIEEIVELVESKGSKRVSDDTD
jgi:hypothetical protein